MFAVCLKYVHIARKLMCGVYSYGSWSEEVTTRTVITAVAVIVH